MKLNNRKLNKEILEPDRNTKIWRYLSLAKFIDMLKRQSLFFRRLDLFSDRLEGTIPKGIDVRVWEESDNCIRQINYDENFIKSYCSYTLANCWSKNNSESWALWKIYTGGIDTGVAIETTYYQLKEALKKNKQEILLGNVQYTDAVRDIKKYHIAFTKTLPYKFESEVRAIILDQYSRKFIDGRPSYIPSHASGLYVKVPLKNIINQITVSPISPKWYIDLIKDVMKKYGFNFPLVESLIKEEISF